MKWLIELVKWFTGTTGDENKASTTKFFHQHFVIETNDLGLFDITTIDGEPIIFTDVVDVEIAKLIVEYLEDNNGRITSDLIHLDTEYTRLYNSRMIIERILNDDRISDPVCVRKMKAEIEEITRDLALVKLNLIARHC